jgi:hypothetical protein
MRQLVTYHIPVHSAWRMTSQSSGLLSCVVYRISGVQISTYVSAIVTEFPRFSSVPPNKFATRVPSAFCPIHYSLIIVPVEDVRAYSLLDPYRSTDGCLNLRMCTRRHIPGDSNFYSNRRELQNS